MLLFEAPGYDLWKKIRKKKPFSLLDFDFFRGCLESTFVVVSLSLTGALQCCVCQSVSSKNVLGTRTGERQTDGTIRSGRHRPTLCYLVQQGVCSRRSRLDDKSLPQYLIVLCHPRCASCTDEFVVVMMARLTGFLLHDELFLPDKPHQTWHPSLTQQASSSRHITQSVRDVGRVVFLPVWQPPRILVCLMSNQNTSSEVQSCHYE